MVRVLLTSLFIFSLAAPAWSQNLPRADTGVAGDNRILLGVGNPLLAQGSEALRAGDYDEGIRLTLLGLERERTTDLIKAGALSNICAAYAAKEAPDTAIEYCTQSLEINRHNWRAFSNRSYAYWLKEMYPEATHDLEAAVAINPRARQVLQIRGMLNEAGLRPRVTVEDHQ